MTKTTAQILIAYLAQNIFQRAIDEMAKENLINKGIYQVEIKTTKSHVLKNCRSVDELENFLSKKNVLNCIFYTDQPGTFFSVKVTNCYADNLGVI